jgi:hypothetical protein
METTDVLVGQMEWALRNVNNNLDVIPDDKLNWKPAPTAKSVLEIVNHVGGTIYGIAQALGEGEINPQFMPAANREEAKVLLKNGAEAYIAKVRALTPQDMARTLSMPFGELPLPFVAGMPVIELINHHGQITYIETLLGDEESHLSM